MSAFSDITASLRAGLRSKIFKLVPKYHQDEYIVAKHIAYIIKERRIDLVVDVGANNGQFATMLRERAGYAGRIESFEPQPELFDVLAAKASRDAGWRVRNLALGARQETLKLNITASSVFSSFLKPNGEIFSQLNVVDRQVDVPVERLDAVLAAEGARSRRILLKTDTQGFDEEVMRGAEGVLGEIEAIVSELSFLPIYHEAPDYEHMMSYQRKLGYTLSGIYPVSLTRSQAIECDCVMVRQETPKAGDHIPYGRIFTA